MIQRELEQCTHTHKQTQWLEWKGLIYQIWKVFNIWDDHISYHPTICYPVIWCCSLSSQGGCWFYQVPNSVWCDKSTVNFHPDVTSPQKNKVYVRGCIKDGDLFTRYSDVCWLILKNTRFFRRFSVSWWVIPACSFLGNKNKPWLVDENTSALSKCVLCLFLGIWFSRLRD